MAGLYFHDDARARAFAPFALTRPASELRAGAEIVRRRWEQALGLRASGFLSSPHLADFSELDTPPSASGVLAAGAIVVNSRSIPALGALPDVARTARWTCGGRTVAVRLAAAVDVARFADGTLHLDALPESDGGTHAIQGRVAEELWDYIRDLNAQITDDALALAPTLDIQPVDAFTVIGTHALLVERGATIDPFVVFDVSAGPVLVRRDAVVQSFTRLIGPCYVGERSTIAGGRVGGCAIGAQCKVAGEMSASILLGHANKGHDGFVGHSMLGRWVNLGAGTTTSNLKNTYGSVALWTPAGVRDTGLQFVGTLFGDHAKTGIGTRLTTGCVISAGANVFGSAMPPKFVPPFAWGDAEPYGRFALDKFLVVAERVMARRGIALGERGRAALIAAHAAGTGRDA